MRWGHVFALATFAAMMAYLLMAGLMSAPPDAHGFEWWHPALALFCGLGAGGVLVIEHANRPQPGLTADELELLKQYRESR